LQNHKFNVLLDLQWGSCGKGKFAPFLADKFGVVNASCSHRPNAGHTVRVGEQSWVLKCLPSAVALRNVDGRRMNCYLSAGASFNWQQLDREMAEFAPSVLVRHPRMLEVLDRHREEEQQSLAFISSTMQGAGAALVEKIQRRTRGLTHSADLWLDAVLGSIRDESMLHEAAQGWELSLDHGYKYPYVTSRNCGTAAALDEMGVSPRLLGDVYGVFRPYPIRVGNFEQYTSGPAHGAETTWAEVLTAAGAPQDVIEEHVSKYEFTTVTKRRRRVFEFSFQALRRANQANGVSHLILNFAQYLDWEIRGQKGRFTREQLPARIRDFVHRVESTNDAKIAYIGTGAEHSEAIELC
jgi:adenylosuccinate synthase